MRALLLLWSWSKTLATAATSATSSLIEDHKAIRRLLVCWAASLITWVTYQLFVDPTKITGPSAAAYASVTALLTAAIGLYQVTRAKEDSATPAVVDDASEED